MSEILDILTRCDIDFNSPDDNPPGLFGLFVVCESHADAEFIMRYAVSGELAHSRREYVHIIGEIFITEATLREWGIRPIFKEWVVTSSIIESRAGMKLHAYAGWEMAEKT